MRVLGRHFDYRGDALATFATLLLLVHDIRCERIGLFARQSERVFCRRVSFEFPFGHGRRRKFGCGVEEDVVQVLRATLATERSRGGPTRGFLAL